MTRPNILPAADHRRWNTWQTNPHLRSLIMCEIQKKILLREKETRPCGFKGDNVIAYPLRCFGAVVWRV